MTSDGPSQRLESIRTHVRSMSPARIAVGEKELLAVRDASAMLPSQHLEPFQESLLNLRKSLTHASRLYGEVLERLPAISSPYTPDGTVASPIAGRIEAHG